MTRSTRTEVQTQTCNLCGEVGTFCDGIFEIDCDCDVKHAGTHDCDCCSRELDCYCDGSREEFQEMLLAERARLEADNPDELTRLIEKHGTQDSGVILGYVAYGYKDLDQFVGEQTLNEEIVPDITHFWHISQVCVGADEGYGSGEIEQLKKKHCIEEGKALSNAEEINFIVTESKRSIDLVLPMVLAIKHFLRHLGLLTRSEFTDYKTWAEAAIRRAERFSTYGEEEYECHEAASNIKRSITAKSPQQAARIFGSYYGVVSDHPKQAELRAHLVSTGQLKGFERYAIMSIKSPSSNGSTKNYFVALPA